MNSFAEVTLPILGGIGITDGVAALVAFISLLAGIFVLVRGEEAVRKVYASESVKSITMLLIVVTLMGIYSTTSGYAQLGAITAVPFLATLVEVLFKIGYAAAVPFLAVGLFALSTVHLVSKVAYELKNLKR